MKNKSRILLILLCVALLLSLFAGCSKAPTEEPQKEAEQQEPSQSTGDGLPVLTALEIDDGYGLSFDPQTRSYEIRIPDGRPRIPKLTAQADPSCTVSVTQAVLPDGAESGTAYVTVTDAAGLCGEYAVKFIRDASLGFHLQYDDFYTFLPDGAEAAERYESSDPSVIAILPDGTLHAERLSDEPVTLTAYAADGSQAGTLTVDRIVKAPINIFLITGQSNAYGTYDIPANVASDTFIRIQRELALAPKPGTVLCTDVNSVGGIENEMYDLSIGRTGFSPALGKTWYELTGEKTLMIQTAVGGAPIEAWMKPEGSVRNTYGNVNSNFYETTEQAFRRSVTFLTDKNSGYELNRVHAYWLQGETGMASSFNPNKLSPGVGDWDFGSHEHIIDSDEYYEIFMKNMEYFREDFGCEFMGILLVRAVTEVSSSESLDLQLLTDLVPARAAQYALHNSNGTEISLVSRVCDMARMGSWEDRDDPGWGMMGCNSLHYNQIGHNANGVAAAENTYRTMYDREGRRAYDIEVIAPNGRDRIEEGETLVVVAGETCQTAAMVLPMYTDTPLVTCESADPSVCSIDRFGLITASPDAAGKETTVTYRCEVAGLTKTIRIHVGKREQRQIVYEWNFDKNDLTEKNGLNNLTVSQKTGSSADYSITDGVYTSQNNKTNLSMEHPILISSKNDWCIEWRGSVKENSALLGTAGNWTNFMYLAYSVPFEVENPFRIVGADGTAIMIPYGQYAGYNTSGLNTWKAQYTASIGTLILYLNGTTVVGTAPVPAGWYAEFTNLFGSYFEGTDVDYHGSMDWIKVTMNEDVIVE